MLAKVDPYLRPLYDALYDMLDPDKLAAYMERGTIEVAPLAFMRGRTLNDSFIILDEAQNTSPEQMQMFLTRLGFGSKIVVTGDVTQIDLPREQASGLIQVQDILGRHRRDRVRPLRPRGRRPPQARAADRRGLQAPRGRDRHAAAPVAMVAVEVANRSGATVEAEAAVALARQVLADEGIEEGELGLRFVGPDEMRALKLDHLGIDEVTDVLSFPIDGTRAARRRACRASSATPFSARRSSARPGAAPLVHGLLHLVGYDHGSEMAEREARCVMPRWPIGAREASSKASTSRSKGSSTSSGRSGTCGSTSWPPCVVLVAGVATGVTKLELIALLLAIAFVLITEMINSAIEADDRRLDDLLRPDCEAREGHRRRRRPDRNAERDRDRVPRLLRPDRGQQRAAARTARGTRPAQLTLIALVVTIILVIAAKALHRQREAALGRAARPGTQPLPSPAGWPRRSSSGTATAS